MPTAVQTPYLSEPVEQKGKHLFRKQVLPVSAIDHPDHGKIDFTRDRLSKLVEAFKQGAYDMVPFTLNNERNEHNDDPERVRGEVKGLELANDGLFALIETSDRGAELIREHPNFPVSVRLCDPGNGGFDEALAHVAATPDPVVKGMRGWEAIEASRDVEVLDLSGGAFSTPAISTDADTKGTDALTEEEQSTFKRLLSKVTGGGKPDEEPASPESGGTPDDEPEMSEEEMDRLVAGLLEEADEEPEPENDKEPVAAAMSDEDRSTLEMARKTSLKTGRRELDSRLNGYVKDGVPPAMVEAARDLLSSDETLIEFAREDEPKAAEKTFEALDKAKGTIEFAERGSLQADPDDDEAKQARELAEAAHKDYTGAGS